MSDISPNQNTADGRKLPWNTPAMKVVGAITDVAAGIIDVDEDFTGTS